MRTCAAQRHFITTTTLTTRTRAMWMTSLVRGSSRSLNTWRHFSKSATLRETFTVQDEQDFKDKVLGNPDPVVVDFNAVWCGPCKMLTPRLEAAVASTEGKVHLAMVDIDDMSDLALDHGVQAVPTVVAVKDGKIVDKFVGVIDEDQLDAFVKKLEN